MRFPVLFVQKLRLEKGSNEVAGILGCYLGYPKKNVLYLGCLFLRPNWQGKGLGEEIVSYIEQNIHKNDTDEIRIGVGLKNWRALIFWTKLCVHAARRRGQVIRADNSFGAVALPAV